MFQANAAINAQSTVAMVTTSVSTSPLPMVAATAPPSSAPVKFKRNAAWRWRSRNDHDFEVRDDGGDGVRGIVKAVLYSKMIAARTTQRKVIIAGELDGYA